MREGAKCIAYIALYQTVYPTCMPPRYVGLSSQHPQPAWPMVASRVFSSIAITGADESCSPNTSRGHKVGEVKVTEVRINAWHVFV